MNESIGFDTADHGLIPPRLDTWGGFLFLCFDHDAPGLADFLGDLPDRVAAYGLADMVCARRKEFMIECNWKLFVENAKESYHIATVHRHTINKYASARSSGYWVEETAGEYVCTFAQHDGSMALLRGDDGFPVNERLAGLREAGGTTAPLIYPSTYLACTIDCAWYLELHPLGPHRTRLVHGALFPPDRVKRDDFETTAANYCKRWDKVLP
jgi:choline monooxygenase